MQSIVTIHLNAEAFELSDYSYVTYSQIRMFLTNIVDGLRYKDSFSIAFAKSLGLIKECPVCGRLICVCD